MANVIGIGLQNGYDQARASGERRGCKRGQRADGGVNRGRGDRAHQEGRGGAVARGDAFFSTSKVAIIVVAIPLTRVSAVHWRGRTWMC